MYSNLYSRVGYNGMRTVVSIYLRYLKNLGIYIFELTPQVCHFLRGLRRGSKWITATNFAAQPVTIRENYFCCLLLTTFRHEENNSSAPKSKVEITRKKLLSCSPHLFEKNKHTNLASCDTSSRSSDDSRVPGLAFAGRARPTVHHRFELSGLELSFGDAGMG